MKAKIHEGVDEGRGGGLTLNAERPGKEAR